MGIKEAIRRVDEQEERLALDTARCEEEAKEREAYEAATLLRCRAFQIQLGLVGILHEANQLLINNEGKLTTIEGEKDIIHELSWGDNNDTYIRVRVHELGMSCISIPRIGVLIGIKTVDQERINRVEDGVVRAFRSPGSHREDKLHSKGLQQVTHHGEY